MAIKHRIPCFDSEILVVECTGEGAYQVSIQSSKNPLSTGNQVGKYPSEEQAVQKSGQFCSFYKAAREKGYYLKADSFVKPDYDDIPVSLLMEARLNADDFHALIKE